MTDPLSHWRAHADTAVLLDGFHALKHALRSGRRCRSRSPPTGRPRWPSPGNWPGTCAAPWTPS